MRVVKSCILELREYKGRRIVCQLNLDGTTKDVSINDLDSPQDFHWFDKEHWQAFDAKLENLVDNLPDKARGSSAQWFENNTFRLNENLTVQVTKSLTTVKTLLECLGHTMVDRKNNTLALDFAIQRVVEEKGTQVGRNLYSPCRSVIEDLEYLPQPITSQNTSADSSSVLYVPSNSAKCDMGSDDPDRYSPKLILTPSLSPVYKPRPIKNRNVSAKKEKNIFDDSSEDDVSLEEPKKAKEKTKLTSTANTKKAEEHNGRKGRALYEPDCDQFGSAAEHNVDIGTLTPQTAIELSDDSPIDKLKISSPSHDDNIDLMDYVKPQKKEHKEVQEKQSEVESKSKQRNDTRKHESKQNDSQSQELRRSARSPVKPCRFQTEIGHVKKHTNTHKKRTKDIMRKCFGSDADSDCDFVEVTPVKPAPKTPNIRGASTSSKHSSSSVKKRKRDEEKKEATCEQEKKSMSKWLTKKKPEELERSNTHKTHKSRAKDKEAKPEEMKKKSTTSSSSNSGIKMVKRIVYPSAEEIAENERREQAQMQVNENMKEMLKDLIKVPKRVEILSLNDMSADEILKTFTKYKNQLDFIFHKLRSKQKVTGYNGINHYSVIELIDNDKQLKMMQKLGEVYEKDTDGTSLYSTLFANALMPEWLVQIFKDKYNFSHNEAVTRLEEQRQYMQYMDVEDHQE